MALLTLVAGAVALTGPPAGVLLTGPGWSLVRIPLGLLAALVLPGHALQILLFPRSTDLDVFERVALAIGLSLAQIPLLALLLDRTSWGLAPVPMIVSLATVTLLWCLAGAVRLARVGEGERLSLGNQLRLPAWRSLTAVEHVAVLLGGVLVVVIGWSLFVVLTQPSLPPLTEFFMLGTHGLAESYPHSAAPGEPVSVTLGVTNQEGSSLDYRVVARHQGVDVAEIPLVHVEPGATWSDRLTFALSEPGFKQPVDILLFRASDQEPYRRLHLVIDVLPAGLPTPVRVVVTPMGR